jgi:hypothetical protein
MNRHSQQGIERFIAINAHKHYLVVGGLNAHMEMVLPPRRISIFTPATRQHYIKSRRRQGMGDVVCLRPGPTRKNWLRILRFKRLTSQFIGRPRSALNLPLHTLRALRTSRGAPPRPGRVPIPRRSTQQTCHGQNTTAAKCQVPHITTGR